MDFPFSEAPNTASITCRHIMEGEESVTYVSHDADDGMWQFLCGREHGVDDAGVVALQQIFEFDPSVGVLSEIPMGTAVARTAPGSDWMLV